MRHMVVHFNDIPDNQLTKCRLFIVRSRIFIHPPFNFYKASRFVHQYNGRSWPTQRTRWQTNKQADVLLFKVVCLFVCLCLTLSLTLSWINGTATIIAQRKFNHFFAKLARGLVATSFGMRSWQSHSRNVCIQSAGYELAENAGFLWAPLVVPADRVALQAVRTSMILQQHAGFALADRIRVVIVIRLFRSPVGVIHRNLGRLSQTVRFPDELRLGAKVSTLSGRPYSSAPILHVSHWSRHSSS